MPTTSNFGWTTPADTDLVKDGAAAIRTLGNGVDSSFVDLKGGTSGQILSKNSDTDLDFVWIANDQGDITAVTAGTGISGGGTSGAVTITNSMATEITASGDIIVGTGSGTFDNLPIGSTGQVLTADTTVSPYKVKWAAGATISAVRKSSDQSISSSTTLTNDSQLKFAVGANETWIFVCWLSAISTVGSINIKKTFTGPAGSTILHSPPDIAINSDGVIRVQQVYAGGTSFTGYTDNLQRPQWLQGTILNGSTAGDLQLQWAQDTSSATAQTVKAGSFIYGIKVS